MITRRDIIRLVEGIDGLAVEGIELNKHYRVRVRTPNGKSHLFFIAVTPSDYRGELNNRAYLKRLRRDNGAELCEAAK